MTDPKTPGSASPDPAKKHTRNLDTTVKPDDWRIAKIQGKPGFQGTFNDNVFCDSFDTRL